MMMKQYANLLAAFISCVVLCFSASGVEECRETLKKDGVQFIMDNMPDWDREHISLSRVESEVDDALAARFRYPWASSVPWEIYRNDVLPYAVIDESRDDWRRGLEAIMSPLVKDCLTAKDAILTIASNIGKTVGVKYSVEREKPNQSPKESMKSGLVSCTGQSILLVDSLRSIGIPARLAGVLLWSHIRGNHTWVEAWCDGEWMMIEWNEKDFNTPWVMENVGMLNVSKQEHKVIASSWGKGNTSFPLVWKYKTSGSNLIPPSPHERINGVDVTDRYMALAKKWYDQNATPANTQRLYIDFSERTSRKAIEVVLKDPNGKELGRGITPSPEQDVRQFLKLFIPIGSVCFLEWFDSAQSLRQVEVTATSTPVQIINLIDSGKHR